MKALTRTARLAGRSTKKKPWDEDASSYPDEKADHGKHHDDHYNGTRETMVPWYISPAECWNEKLGAFSPRREASVLELFFDLFFVANLATFTGNHGITNWSNFGSYIAFFFILWTTWFHVVCFDARFACDSVWERACKTIHFCVFAAFALVGYKYHPAEDEIRYTPAWIYRLLCWALFGSRLLLGFQYLLTTIHCSKHSTKNMKLTLPLGLSTCLFLAASVSFAGLNVGFPSTETSVEGDISGVYTVIICEIIGTITISSVWTQVSFKATHIAERLGLLGLIIIGEGVIGTTKTTTRIMGRTGVYFEGCMMILCIVVILTLIWTIYFDNLPKYRFGTVKQQFWMVLHFPLHLAVLGVVEGMQHIALARYISEGIDSFALNTVRACVRDHLDGPALTQNLTANVEQFKLGGSVKGSEVLQLVFDQIYLLGNLTGVCAPENTTMVRSITRGVPEVFLDYYKHGTSAISDGEFKGIEVGAHSWIVVYTYFWCAIMLLFFCLTASSLLADRGFDWKRFRWAAIGSRTIVVIFSALALALGRMNLQWIQNWMSTSTVLPTVVLQFCLVCLGDRLSRVKRMQRESKLYDFEAWPGTSGGMKLLERDVESTLSTNAYGYRRRNAISMNTGPRLF